MCKLIASEELWLLLDALQEPVPDEVHQHLENINTSTTPLLVQYIVHVHVYIYMCIDVLFYSCEFKTEQPCDNGSP